MKTIAVNDGQSALMIDFFRQEEKVLEQKLSDVRSIILKLGKGESVTNLKPGSSTPTTAKRRGRPVGFKPKKIKKVKAAKADVPTTATTTAKRRGRPLGFSPKKTGKATKPAANATIGKKRGRPVGFSPKKALVEKVGLPAAAPKKKGRPLGFKVQGPYTGKKRGPKAKSAVPASSVSDASSAVIPS